VERFRWVPAVFFPFGRWFLDFSPAVCFSLWRDTNRSQISKKNASHPAILLTPQRIHRRLYLSNFFPGPLLCSLLFFLVGGFGNKPSYILPLPTTSLLHQMLGIPRIIPLTNFLLRFLIDAYHPRFFSFFKPQFLSGTHRHCPRIPPNEYWMASIGAAGLHPTLGP